MGNHQASDQQKSSSSHSSVSPAVPTNLHLSPSSLTSSSSINPPVHPSPSTNTHSHLSPSSSPSSYVLVPPPETPLPDIEAASDNGSMIVHADDLSSDNDSMIVHADDLSSDNDSMIVHADDLSSEPDVAQLLFSDSGEESDDRDIVEDTQESNDNSIESIREYERHLAAVKQAMKIKGILEHTLAHGVFVGPAGSGKSSLLSRLVGEMPSSTSPSTGVANRVVQVEVRKSSSIAVSVHAFSNFTWLKILYDEEAIRLVTQVTSYLTNQETTSTLMDQANQLPVTTTSSVYENSSLQVPATASSSLSTQHDTLASQLQNVANSEANIPLSYPSGYVAPMGVFKNALHQGRFEHLRQHFENSWSLYLTDTGGQMEFQEVLPLLVSGPSIFFITFRLDQDLNQRFTIEYRLLDGERSEPYDSSLTVEEAILQTLASVASMGTFTYKGPQMKSVPLKPKVLIVGTHKDKLDKATAELKIKEIDDYLQKLIRSTSHYREDLVEFSSESQLIFTVNNLSEDDSDFKKIRSGVERVVHHSNFKMSFPSHWLIFSLVLRQQMIEDSIINFDECLAIAQDCGITDHEELNHALWFLHTKIGLIRHFPTPSLRDTVIRDPQILFDQVTHLIVKTFTFENVSERRSTEFKKRGIFSFEDFRGIFQSSCHFFPPKKQLLLLEQLRIVAPFQTDEGLTKYFLPCVLAHSEVCTSPVLTSDIPPLLITFKCGYCPKGLAGALIIYLLTNEMGSKFKWELKTDQIFRDQVTFLVSPYDIITLKIHPTFLECVHFRTSLPRSAQKSKSYSVESICDTVCHFIEKGIQKTLSDLKFTSDTKHAVSFFCQDTDCVKSNGPHPATDPKADEDGPCSLWCRRSGAIVISSPPAGCSVWFGKESQAECDQHAGLKGKILWFNYIDKRCCIQNTGFSSHDDVSPAVTVVEEPLTVVHDSVECSGQFESRDSLTESEEQRNSESMLQCVWEFCVSVCTCVFLFLSVHVYMYVNVLVTVGVTRTWQL